MSRSDFSNTDASCKVLVTDLPAGVTDTDLSLHFSQVESAVGAFISGPGMGYVVYGSPSEATSAISSYNGSMFLGCTIKVGPFVDLFAGGGNNDFNGKGCGNDNGWGKGGKNDGKGGGKDDGWSKGGGKDDGWGKGGGKDDGWGKGGGKDDGWSKGGGKDSGWGKGGGKDDGWGKGGGKDDSWGKGGGKDDGWGKGGGKDDGWSKGGGKDDGWSKGGGKDDGWSKGGGKDDGWGKGGGKDNSWGKDGSKGGKDGGGKDSWGKDGGKGGDKGKAPDPAAGVLSALPPGPDGQPNAIVAALAAAAASAGGSTGATASSNPMAFVMGMMDGMTKAGGGKGGAPAIDPAVMQGMLAGMMGGMQGMKVESSSQDGKTSNIMVDPHGHKWDLNEWELQPNGQWKCKVNYEKKAPDGVWQDWSSDASQTHWVDYSRQEPWDGNAKLIKIKLPPDSPIVSQGFPAEAPSISYVKGNELFSSASHILQEIVGDLTTMVKIEHDTDFTQFPDVARAVKEAGGEKECSIAVGVCPEAAKWAVGIGAGYKGREFAVKLSLAVALAGSDPEIVATLERTYPGFAKLCAQLHTGTSTAQTLNKLDSTSKGGLMENPAAPQSFTGPSPGVHLIQLQASGKLVSEGLPAEGPAIAWNKDMKDSFGISHVLLSELCDSSKVDFRDDTDWTVLPEVGAAITAAGAEHNCFCIAISPNKHCWGVGIANGWKGRQPAAKLALALALAMHAGKLEELAARYPEFGAMCAQAGLVELNAAKRAKVAAPMPDMPGASGAPGAPCLD